MRIFLLPSLIGAIGRRTSADEIMPISAAATFTGTGFVSMNICFFVRRVSGILKKKNQMVSERVSESQGKKKKETKKERNKK